MKKIVDLLSKSLILVHYPAAIGSFACFYWLLRWFGMTDFIVLIAATLCLGASAVLLLGMFHALWASDQSPRYLLYSKKIAQCLEILSVFLAITPPVLIWMFTSVKFWPMLISYLNVLAGVFIAQIAGGIALMVLAAHPERWEEVPRRTEPKPTLAVIIASMRESAHTYTQWPPMSSMRASPTHQARAAA